MKKHEYIRLVHADPAHSEWFVVNWCLGNTCNYSCSYCPENLHNGSLDWPQRERVLNFIDRVIAQTAPRRVYFEFTGGEVTLYRHFIEICKHIKSRGAHVGLISNGSRTLRWWRENRQYFDHVCLSFHPEHADPDHFYSVAELLHEHLRVHINIMMKPQLFYEGYRLAQRVVSLSDISLALQPLMEDLNGRLFDYDATQQAIMDGQHGLLTSQIRYTRDFPNYRGAMTMIYPDGREETTGTPRFINAGTNDWEGWQCHIGVEQIIVDLGGRIYRGWCRVGGGIGSIHDSDLQIPQSAITCNKNFCHCNFDIMSTKELKN